MVTLDGGAARAVAQQGLTNVRAGHTVVLEMVGPDSIQQVSFGQPFIP